VDHKITPFKKVFLFTLFCVLISGGLEKTLAYSDNIKANYGLWQESLTNAIEYCEKVNKLEVAPENQKESGTNQRGKKVFSHIRKLLLQIGRNADWLIVFVQSTDLLSDATRPGLRPRIRSLHLIAERFNEIATEASSYQVFQEYRMTNDKRSMLQLAALLRDSSNPSALKQMERNLPSLLSSRDQKFDPLLKEVSRSLCKTQEPWTIENLLLAIADTSDDSQGSSVVFHPKKPFESPAASGLAYINSELIVPTLNDILMDNHKASSSPTVKYLSLAVLKKLSTPEATQIIRNTASTYSDEIGTYASSLL